ncbi:hypothetical protein LCGC14_2988790, partial [marine sediment metagenome]
MEKFDEALLGGVSPGELIVVIGKPGHGKTSLVQSWTVTLAKQVPSLWFSYEMLNKPLWNKFVAMGASTKEPIFIPTRNDSGNIEWVTKIIEKGIKERGVKLVVIDHLGYLKPPKGTYSNQADAITYTARHLKFLAEKY